VLVEYGSLPIVMLGLADVEDLVREVMFATARASFVVA
jgi:hypothetical protein